MSVEWDGLEEFKAQLRSLPSDLAGEAGHIVEASVNAAETAIKAGYDGRKELVDHVSSDIVETAFGAEGIVRNTSKLAWIYENGTQARHYITRRGVTHLTGSMPPGHVFIPNAQRERRRMYEELKDMIARHPLAPEVSGDA